MPFLFYLTNILKKNKKAWDVAPSLYLRDTEVGKFSILKDCIWMDCSLLQLL